MKRTRKKQAKQKKRELKKRIAKQHSEAIQREQQLRSRYPEIVIDDTHGDPAFVELVKQAMAGIDFDDRSQFCDGERTFYRLIRQYGFETALRTVQNALADDPQEDDPTGRKRETMVLMKYGTLVFDSIPEELRRRYLPYNDVQVVFAGNRIVLRFSSMLSQRGNTGRVFYRRNMPTIEFDGVARTVAFSRHAIERLCERFKPRYLQYAAAGDVHAFFSTCVYFEPVILKNGQPAIALYNICGPEGSQEYDIYVKHVLGEDNLDHAAGKPYYRVGYCPVVFEGDFAKATTFLCPGYHATPERLAISRSRLSWHDRNAIIKTAASQSTDDVLLNNAPETIRWFHDNGVPQVVQFQHPVFAC